MFRDEKTGKDFAGNQNPWLKRLGLVIVIVGIVPATFWLKHCDAFLIVFYGILGLAIVRFIWRTIVRIFKDTFGKL